MFRVGANPLDTKRVFADTPATERETMIINSLSRRGGAVSWNGRRFTVFARLNWNDWGIEMGAYVARPAHGELVVSIRAALGPMHAHCSYERLILPPMPGTRPT